MTIPAVLHPPVVALVRFHLKTALEVPVGEEAPSVKPSRFLTVSRIGGTRGTEVSDLPVVSVEAWAATWDAAEALALAARQAVNALAGTVVDGVAFYRVSDVSGPSRLPHLSGTPRYAYSAQLHVRSR